MKLVRVCGLLLYNIELILLSFIIMWGCDTVSGIRVPRYPSETVITRLYVSVLITRK